MSINVLTLIGNLGGDPDVKYFESGSVNAKFSLAVRKSKNDDPDWFNCVAWGKTAETIANYLRKGSKVAIDGSLGEESWTDRQTGELRTSTIVKVERLEMLGKKGDSTDE